MTLEQLTVFLGWCTIGNFALMAAATIVFVAMPRLATSIHGRMFALSEQDISRSIYNFLAIWKVSIIVLNLVPYLVLRLVF